MEELVLTSSYPAPVDQLLTCGKTHTLSPDEWPNYLEMGLGPEHIPDLIRLATDEQLNTSDIDCPEVWAPQHACRALAQLHAEEAIEPLIDNLEMLDDSGDFISEELPTVFSMLGPVALPRLGEYMADSSHNEWARACAIEAIKQTGIDRPETRSECIELLTTQLALFEENDYDINDFLITALADMKAIETAPLVKQAFDADRVEEFMIGDWDDIQVRFGLKSAEELKEQRAREREEYSLRQERDYNSTRDVEYTRTSSQISYKSSHKSVAATRRKAKNKMAKQSRKKNRKR